MNTNFDFHSIIQQFQIEGDLQDVVAYGEGHINLTYAVALRERGGNNRRYILQCINHEVFKNPEAVMKNIERVTGHIRRVVTAAGENPTRKTITLVPTFENRYYYVSPLGEYWRLIHFIEGARSYQQAIDLKHCYTAAKAFGKFLTLLGDFPADQLYETIPNFHHTPKRFQDFLITIERDPVNRAKTVDSEIKFILERESDAGVLVDYLESGTIPERVTHNDTKIDNVMIDDKTGEGVCVIDLDTVMPGLVPMDFGDLVRSAANGLS